ncbi:MAG: hypothetical protein ACI4BH_11990 [Muribaculaceae bacterium]
MGGPPSGPFKMPMFRSFVPEWVRPWIYSLIVLTFQMSGGVYSGAMAAWVGETSHMREDFLMCVYCTLGGMAAMFPLLFRMKFRFTNKTLLMSAASVVIVCNLLAPMVTFLPLLWLICFVEGMAKLQGTFECISNIQRWLTPRFDFAQFFPKLNIYILVSMQTSGIVSAYLAYYMHWQMMHLVIVLLMLMDLALLVLLTRHVRIMPKLPLYAVDWLGMMLWVLFFMQCTFVCTYGDYYDWLHSDVIVALIGSSVITLCFSLHRMKGIRHPYIEPETFRYRNFLPLIVLVMVLKIFSSLSKSVEPIYLGAGMHYSSMVTVRLDIWGYAGILLGLAFAYVWVFRWRRNYCQLIAGSLMLMALYMMWMYFVLSGDINIEKLYVPVVLRNAADAIVASSVLGWLQSMMKFQHFFQGLGLLNMVNMHLGGAVGGALCTRAMHYAMHDNILRYSGNYDAVMPCNQVGELLAYMSRFVSDVQLVSIKQIYGISVLMCIVVVLIMLIWDRKYIHTAMHYMPEWRAVGYRLRRTFSAKELRP